MTRALMIGFGSVGQALAAMIGEHADRLAGLGFLFRAVGVFTKTKGNVVNPQGVDLEKLLADVAGGGKFTGDVTSMTALDACRLLDYDVLVELSPLTVAERGEPAVSHIASALSRGRHVVTANKGPVAFAYGELSAMAAQNGCRFLFESTVQDGSPVFNLVRRCMKGNRVTAFSGILNSTTNYILTRMEEGVSMEAATEEAILSGSTEADPSYDIDGWDAATKVAVLARVLMNAQVTPPDVTRSGIREVTHDRIRDAMRRGKRLKLMCRGWYEGADVRTSVGVEELDAADLFAGMSAHDSAICIESDMMVPNYIVQKDPTPRDTAFGVLEDMLSLGLPDSP